MTSPPLVPDVTQMGEITVNGDDGYIRLLVDRGAVDRQGNVHLLSVVGHAMQIKALTGLLNGNVKYDITFSGMSFVSRDGSPYITRLYRMPGGYQRYSQKLAYEKWHGLFATRADGFLPCVSEPSLWAEVKKSRFTTPVLREWVPYVWQEFAAEGLLRLDYCFNCSCGMLLATSKDLDKVVSRGLRNGLIAIPGKSDAA